MVLKKIEKQDIEMLRVWRNSNALSFLNREHITKENQKQWWYKYQADITYMIYLILINDLPVGTVGIRVLPDEIRFENVLLGNTAYRRQGIMGYAMQRIMKTFVVSKYTLFVVKRNISAIDLYEKKLGFKITFMDRISYKMERSKEVDPAV